MTVIDTPIDKHRNVFTRRLLKTFLMKTLSGKVEAEAICGPVEYSIGFGERMELEFHGFLERFYDDHIVVKEPHCEHDFPDFGITRNAFLAEKYFFEVKTHKADSDAPVSLGSIRIVKDILKNNPEVLENLLFVTFHWQETMSRDFLITAIEVETLDEIIGLNSDGSSLNTGKSHNTDILLSSKNNLSLSECFRYIDAYPKIPSKRRKRR